MADTVTYVIKIAGGDGSGGGGGAVGGNTNPKAIADSPDGESFNSGIVSQASKGKSFSKLASVAIAVKAIDKAATTAIGRISLYTGHSTLQSRTEIGVQALKQVLTGDIMGLMRNQWNYSEQRDELAVRKTIEKYSVIQANRRASSDGGRTGRN